MTPRHARTFPGRRAVVAVDPVTDPAPSLLLARGLAFSRDDAPVFGPLDLHVDRSEALLVQGDNGAGKTTLLRVLAGLLRADAGTVDIDGRPVDPVHRARNVAYLGHLPGHKGDLTATENLAAYAGLHGARASQTIASSLATVGLGGLEHALARRMSAGQRKRLSLARLWLSPAALWLLDEPYANLDLDGISLVNRMVAAHLRDGGAAVVTTHGAYAAPAVRTRVLHLSTAGVAA